jgi:phage gp46-like protein
MTDIKLRQQVDLRGTFMDWLLQGDGTLSEEEELATAVRVAIATDALADLNEPLPDLDSEDRRGWWGDMDAEAIWGGWSPIGSKNWLLMRAKISDRLSWEGDTVIRAKAYNRAALQPFIARRICSSIDVEAERTGRQEITVTVVMWRGPRRLIELRYQYLWDKVTGEPIPVGSKDRFVTGYPVS